ncbi:tyrosine-protein phosphatase [Enterococcus rivorum]|uniref:Tyrosine-protein phosphatase n=1 Tax=Enterococcus rivorum TaxID=762845 RepID=A0A1E5KX40_9ENTE|nr:CpsB/CapC family capsule biosynthesis tyrosine phosphatase [Enterococcus rivorum]MBP2097205.1 protein-tyrosine phosphatase [Enterococcus rivorum]OEH82440.1 tyrosine protein phosphatase [Enterococcus rivorum]
MIDLHCHILPKIDDGAQSLADSILMAESAVQQGISHILCTPHHNNGRYSNPAKKVISKVSELQQELDLRDIPLTLFEGQEVRIGGSLVDEIIKKEILFADLSNKYILIELPTREIPSYADKLLFELLTKGHTPIIVHPERNYQLMETPNDLIPFLEMGVLTQVTAASYLGGFGKKIGKIAKQMVENNMAHIIASDAHNTGKRGFFMKEAYEQIAKDLGSEKVIAMQQTVKDILNGDEVVVPEYTEIKRMKFKLF